MSLNNAQISHVYATTLLRALQGAGISGICLSPGFRNSPLILAAHELCPEKVFTHIDERGSAFFALGLAKSSGKPAVVICTSGTAAANYFPAILEAFYANVPLIVITADRPHELIGIGANQSMRQDNLYGGHVHLQISIPAPVAGEEGIRHLMLSAKRLVATAMGPRPGPVHLNIAFREPFLASKEEIAQIAKENFIEDGTNFFSTESKIHELPEAIINQLSAARRPCVVVGPGELSAQQKRQMILAAEKCKVPIFAEASSGLACGELGKSDSLLLRFDHYFRATTVQDNMSPDLIIRIGAALTSKTWNTLVEKKKIPQIILDYSGETKNPSLSPANFIWCTRELSIVQLVLCLEQTKSETSWLSSLREIESETEKAMDKHLHQGSLTEWGWLRESQNFIESGSAIFVGNSMQIRDFDSVFRKTIREYRIFSNRGLSGIDGILSTAIGIAAAEKRPTHLFVGDITSLHDLNALSLARRMDNRICLNIWLHNNGGGEIFRLVRTSQSGAPEDWFTTPQALDFAALSKGFRLPFFRIHQLEDLSGLGAEAFSAPGVRLIELMFPGEENMLCRKKFWESFR